MSTKVKKSLKKGEMLQYRVFVVAEGSWMHAPSSDFLFAYLDNSWDATTKEAVTTAFKDALVMSSTIKEAVKTTSGDDVVSGLYLLDQPAMTAAMNSIDGMGMTAANQNENKGSGTAVTINKEFFAAILGGLGGDVEPMMTYLTTQMGDVKVQTSKSSVTSDFGIVVGLISLMPVLNVPVTSFQYVYSSSKTSEWFVNTSCSSTEHHSYDYKYTVVNYNYVKESN
tara:strand:+ start:2216 stop:2890 length:675 start_codon:yes stop_codon:yes gene_type:complete